MSLSYTPGNDARDTTPTLCVLVIITSASRPLLRATYSRHSPLPFSENQPPNTGTLELSLPRGRIAVTPVRISCLGRRADESGLPTVTAATSVIRVQWSGVAVEGVCRGRGLVASPQLQFVMAAEYAPACGFITVSTPATSGSGSVEDRRILQPRRGCNDHQCDDVNHARDRLLDEHRARDRQTIGIGIFMMPASLAPTDSIRFSAGHDVIGCLGIGWVLCGAVCVLAG